VGFSFPIGFYLDGNSNNPLKNEIGFIQVLGYDFLTIIYISPHRK
jgi:hypothetical protein